jgi:protoporphyrin/coproporphyrin ferrochelatase
MNRDRAVLLVSHGTVDELEDLPAFLTNIRRGHAPTPELLAEVRRRYEAIGGRSPLNAICRDVAERLEKRLDVPVRSALRLFRPDPKDALRALIEDGIRKVAVVPLAQHSAYIYGEATEKAASDLAAEGLPRVAVTCAKNWGRSPELTGAFVAGIRAAFDAIGRGVWPRTTLIMSAHSLPLAVVRGGDPYETEFRASAAAIAAALEKESVHHAVCFQSQGMSAGPGGRPVEWLGPDLRAALDDARARGDSHVVVAPIGFLADHVEILYDIDIEARAWANERGLSLSRTRSLNASDSLLDALASEAQPLLASFDA